MWIERDLRSGRIHWHNVDREDISRAEGLEAIFAF